MLPTKRFAERSKQPLENMINSLTWSRKKKSKVVWPCLKVLWFSKDNSTGHTEWKKKKRWTEEEFGISKSGQRKILPARLGQQRTG